MDADVASWMSTQPTGSWHFLRWNVKPRWKYLSKSSKSFSRHASGTTSGNVCVQDVM